VHQGGLAMFKHIVQVLLNLEQFLNNFLKTKYFKKIGASSFDIVGNALDMSGISWR
jgi:cellulose synthase/poly-beta-1,6-N-acetylglucosamine synthase-like glycosyltransferase